ncbi:MAG: peptidylprolyl isomerase [Pseudomonadota bacterium]
MSLIQAHSSLAPIARWLREPLIAFLLLGSAIFTLHGFLASSPKNAYSAERIEGSGEASGDAPSSASLRKIRVTDSVLAMLKSRASFYDGRDPSAEKLNHLVSAWIDDEMIFRHALSQDLHLNDGRMREHLVEKMTALWAGAPQEPDDDALLSHYMENLSEYYTEPRFSFSHVFMLNEPRDPTATLRQLRAGEAVEGDEFWAGGELTDYAESALKSVFGGAFYAALATTAYGEWQGPIPSARGFHFVRIHGVRQPEPRRFEEVVVTVRADVMNSRREQRIRDQLDRISGTFSVVRETADESGS